MIVKGLDSVLRQLNNLQTGLDAKMMQVFSKYATIIMNEAIANAPKSAKTNTGMEVDTTNNRVTIYFDGDMAGWLEFGTGIYASNLLQSRPLEWKKEAMKFFVNGKGRNPAKPYLYPAYERNIPQMMVELENVITQWLQTA